MTPALIVLSCAQGASIQDGGRTGWRRQGISTAGAMDLLSLALANARVGNPPFAAAVELSLAGARFRLEGAGALLAAAGPGVALRLNGRALAPDSSVAAAPGDEIEITPPRDAVHGYLAVGGGIALAPVLGSLSTHQRSGLGPPMLAPGQRLPIGGGAPLVPLALGSPPTPGDGAIRILAGPQEDWFAPDALGILTGSAWRIGARSDRMGRFLEGPRLPPRPGSMVSDGIVAGGIQIPPSGQPIVLMRDCQTTGGYPRIATVISADMDRLAQIPPGALLRFVQVGRAAAVEAARTRAALLAALKPRPAMATDPARLMAENLVSGFIDARRAAQAED